MSKYNVTYACGHSDTIHGPGRDREWRLAREEEKLCPDCFKTKLEADRHKQNVEATGANQAAGLPKLEGTEKQIPWAETLRYNFMQKVTETISKLYSRLADLESKQDQDVERITLIHKHLNRYHQGFDLVLEHTDASWWIDNRDSGIEYIIDVDIENAKHAAAEPPKQIIEAAQAEANVYPEKQVSNLVAEITIKGNVLTVSYSERNETFRQIMRNHGFEWKSGWVRNIGKFNGIIQDRAAEIGNKLLAAGFPVRIYDAEIRRQAIAGEYAPEPKRWIKTMIEGDYKGWLSISWPYGNNNYYDAARKLPGSKYKSPNVIVPPESFMEILDFASMYKFNISDKAQEIIDAARQLREKSLTTGVKVPKSERPPKPGDKPEKLEVPQEVNIDDEFRDKD